MTAQSHRWQQRLESLQAMLDTLRETVQMIEGSNRAISKLEQAALIQYFEVTYEMSWKTLQDLFWAEGYTDVKGPNQSLRQAIEMGYIQERRTWQHLVSDRQRTTHSYDPAVAEAIAQAIINQYLPAFEALYAALQAEAKRANS
jgi:nucleotidyltransferase substrate binding protein (TIGR01987 family)